MSIREIRGKNNFAASHAEVLIFKLNVVLPGMAQMFEFFISKLTFDSGRRSHDH